LYSYSTVLQCTVLSLSVGANSLSLYLSHLSLRLCTQLILTIADNAGT